MKDFEGKVIKVFFNNVQGWVCLSGYFIRYEDNFFIIKETVSNKIKYINRDYIRTIEIIGDIGNE